MPKGPAPRIIRDGSRKRVEVKNYGLPPALSRYASPQMLLCSTCGEPKLADPNGIVLWHGELRDGKVYDCGGYNTPGKPLPKEET